MDNERIVRRIIALFIFIAIILIYSHFAFNPHYYIYVSNPTGINFSSNNFDYSFNTTELDNSDNGVYIPFKATNSFNAKRYCPNYNNGSNVPLLKCGNVSSILKENYIDVKEVRIYTIKCIMYNLPSDEPYIAKHSPIRWYIIKNQGFLGSILIFLAILLYIFDKKREKHINKKNHKNNIEAIIKNVFSKR